MLKYTIYELIRCEAQSPRGSRFVGQCAEDPCPICKDTSVEEHVVEEGVDTLPLLIAYNQRTGHYNTVAATKRVVE